MKPAVYYTKTIICRWQGKLFTNVHFAVDESLGSFSMRRFLCDGDGCGREKPECQATPSRRLSTTLANIDDGAKSLSKHHVRKCLQNQICW